MSDHVVKIETHLKLFAKKVTPLILLTTWLVSSLALSLTILLKFYFASVPWIVSFDIVFYFIVYYIIPAAVFVRLVPFFCPQDNALRKNKWLLAGFMSYLFVFLLWIYVTMIYRLLPDYVMATIPAVLLVYVYFGRSSIFEHFKKSFLSMTLVLMLLLLLPYCCAYGGYALFLNSAQSRGNTVNQVEFVSQASMRVTGNVNGVTSWVRGIYGSHQDFTKFLMSGGGACGETSMLEQAAFEELRFETMKVEFPGEDHAFVEVKVNSTWLVVDPGYNMTLVSIGYRAAARINEVGTISYVSGFCSNVTFVELTQEYVPTDTITIRVTRGTAPVVDASVNLVHELRYGTSSYPVALPGDGFSFRTNDNGTIVIHLGKICQGAYNSEFSKTDPFYQIYVDGQPTDYKVNSTGTGLNTFVPVNLSNS